MAITEEQMIDFHKMPLDSIEAARDYVVPRLEQFSFKDLERLGDSCIERFSMPRDEVGMAVFDLVCAEYSRRILTA
jgi:hypothetical protein